MQLLLHVLQLKEHVWNASRFMLITFDGNHMITTVLMLYGHVCGGSHNLASSIGLIVPFND